jgi:hypothetical protein
MALEEAEAALLFTVKRLTKIMGSWKKPGKSPTLTAELKRRTWLMCTTSEPSGE